MILRTFARYVIPLLFALSFGLACNLAESVDEPGTTPISNIELAETSLLGWSTVEQRIRRGVERGVLGLRLSASDRDDVTAVAMERAWTAYVASDEPIQNPEAWSLVIARRVGLDELRRQKRDILRRAVPLESQTDEARGAAEYLASSAPDPLQLAVKAEKRATVRSSIAEWPTQEQRLANILMKGEADTITAAAWMLREEENARSGEGTMYPQKARLLLEARQGEFEEIV